MEENILLLGNLLIFSMIEGHKLLCLVLKAYTALFLLSPFCSFYMNFNQRTIIDLIIYRQQ